MGLRSEAYVFYSSLLGSVSWCGDTPEKYSVMPKYTSIYKEKLRPLIRNANVYHVLDRPTGEDWDAIEFYDPNTTNAIRGALFVVVSRVMRKFALVSGRNLLQEAA